MSSSASCPRWIGVVAQSLPILSLLLPTRDDCDLTDLALAEAWHSIGCWFKIQNRLLDVGGELCEVEDLSDPCAGDASGAGDLGLVFDLAGGEQVFETNGERHQLGDVRNAGRRVSFLSRLRHDAMAAVGGGDGLEFGLNMCHLVGLAWLEVWSGDLVPKDFSPIGLSVIERLLSCGSCSIRFTNRVIRRLRSPMVR